MFVTIILDGVGIGHAPDAAEYADDGAHTLLHVLESARPDLPNLGRLGLGRLDDLPGVPPAGQPAAAVGTMAPASAGKDSTSGHWEFAGIQMARPFPTYPNGFPDAVIETFVTATRCGGVLANRAASGTEIIEACGKEHLRRGFPIVYTSGDSVFQIAAHTDVTPLADLYGWCRIAREQVCVGEHAVGRVIARPFDGAAGAFTRLADARKDFALKPPSPTIQDRLQAAGIRTVGVGKIGDLFAGVGFDELVPTKNNAQGIEQTLAAIANADENTFIWTNLVDFDQNFGHRNDPQGFADALEAFDRAIPDLEAALPRGARLAISADHGNDPCFPGTDHTRERVPLLVLGPGASGGDLGQRTTFADHAASVAAHFGVAYDGPGESFV